MGKKVISLFSGAGGMDIGFSSAGFEIAVACEADHSCCQTMMRNNPSLKVIEGDIRDVPTSEILQVAGLAPMEAALVIGGPPCQPFSLAGDRKGLEDPRGELLHEFIRVVREALPVAFVMENVKGMANWSGGKALAMVMDELSKPIEFEGISYRYEVVHQVLNAADYGVPQKRERLFVVGNRKFKDFVFPAPMARQVTVREAICGLPPADEPSEVASRVAGTIDERAKNARNP